MLKTLLKLRFYALLSRLVVGGSKKKKAGKGRIVLMALLWTYVIVVFLGMFFAMFSSLAPAMAEMELEWFYFAMFITIAFAVMFIFSVFTAKAQLYEAKDNELLLSLPIPPSTILASRMLSLIMTNLGFEMLVALPAIAAWIMFGGFDLGLVLCFAAVCICLPLLSTALSAFFGWLLALVTARVRNKTLVSTLMSLAFLAVYFYVYSNINTLLTGLLNNATHIAGTMSAILPVWWLAKGVALADIAVLVPGLACLIVPFVLCYIILARTFIKTATTRRGFAKKKYVEREAKTASPFAALVRREASRLLSSATYIMNCAMGAIMGVAAAVLLLIKGGDIMELLAVLPGDFAKLIPLLFAAALCTLSSMTTLSSCSVSLEGNNLWIARSLPVPTAQILKAKLALHLLLSAPATLLAQIACLIVLRPDGLSIVWLLVLPQLFGLVMALLGLWANLRHPKLDWINETQAVKQGFAVMIAMFGGFGLIAIPVVAGIFLARFDWGLVVLPLAFALVLAALALVLWRWIHRRGSRLYEAL